MDFLQRTVETLKIRAKRNWLYRWLHPLPDKTFVIFAEALLSQLRDTTAKNDEFYRILVAHNETLVQHEERLAEWNKAKTSLGVLSAQVSALAAHASAVSLQFDRNNTRLDEIDAAVQAHYQASQTAAQAISSVVNRVQADLKTLLRDRGPDRPEEFARFYLAFENKFRGSREDIAQRHDIYVPYVQTVVKLLSTKTWADLGCGRGEWLEILRSNGAHVLGVDDNTAMLAACRERNLPVHDGDALEFLEQQSPDSLAGVSAFHLIEHLPYRAMLSLFRAAYRALAPGGCLIIETPNPQNVSVGACNFYMDITHQKPIPPMTAEFIANHSGFTQVTLLRLHPFARHAERDSLPTVTEREYCEMFYGPQDYAIVAVK